MIALTAAKALVGRHWKLIAGGVVLVAFAVLLMLYKAEQRRSAKLQGQLIAAVEARKQDRVIYQTAQVAAQAKNEAQVAVIERKQEDITNDASQDYDADLARLRAELGRMRSQANAPARSPADRTQASGVPKAAAPVDGQAQVCLSPGLVLHGAETELQLDALITWVEAQGKVAR